jgi:hypothetical protein
MNYKKITEHSEFIENPFVEKTIQEIQIVKKTQTIRAKEKSEIKLIIDQNGEIEGHTAFMRYIEVDEEKFTKLYLSEFYLFWELSKPAIRVFGYIMTVLRPNEDFFYFIIDDCLNYTKYKHRNSVLSALSTLIECGIIARSKSSVKFFINPMVVFNGSRISFAKTYIKKKNNMLQKVN